MKLPAKQLDKVSLSRLGEEAVSLLVKRDFLSLAARFGYALSFGRDPATAIKEDLQADLAGCRGSFETQTAIASVEVRYFKPGSTGLFATVECVFDAAQGWQMLLELVVTSKGAEYHLTLEQISPVAGVGVRPNRRGAPS